METANQVPKSVFLSPTVFRIGMAVALLSGCAGGERPSFAPTNSKVSTVGDCPLKVVDKVGELVEKDNPLCNPDEAELQANYSVMLSSAERRMATKVEELVDYTFTLPEDDFLALGLGHVSEKDSRGETLRVILFDYNYSQSRTEEAKASYIEVVYEEKNGLATGEIHSVAFNLLAGEEVYLQFSEGVLAGSIQDKSVDTSKFYATPNAFDDFEDELTESETAIQVTIDHFTKILNT